MESPDDVDAEGLFGCLKDRTVLDPDMDLTEPIATDFPSTTDGILHR